MLTKEINPSKKLISHLFVLLMAFGSAILAQIALGQEEQLAPAGVNNDEAISEDVVGDDIISEDIIDEDINHGAYGAGVVCNSATIANLKDKEGVNVRPGAGRSTGNPITKLYKGSWVRVLAVQKGETLTDDVSSNLSSNLWIKVEFYQSGNFNNGFVNYIYISCKADKLTRDDLVKKANGTSGTVTPPPVKPPPVNPPPVNPPPVNPPPVKPPPVKPPPVNPPPTTNPGGGVVIGSGEECNSTHLPSTLYWPVPVNRHVLQPFGVKITYQTCGFHTGLDISASTGSEIRAVADGKVVHVGYMWLNGATTGRGPYAVIIRHGKGVYSTYSHNSRTIVKVNNCVKQGQRIGDVGNLGFSGGPHLHYEIVIGTDFTGVWNTPFQNVCPRYQDPMKFPYSNR